MCCQGVGLLCIQVSGVVFLLLVSWSADRCLLSALSPAWTTIVGLLYHSMHYYLSHIQPADTR